jgi:hypothetical protein
MKASVYIKVQRPAGEIEEVNLTETLGYTGMTPALFDQIKWATIKAGRGKPLSYEIRVDMTEAEADYREVARLQALAERAVDNPVEYHTRECAAREAKAAWIARYPEEAAKRAEQAKQEEAARREAAKVSDPYNL